MGVDEELSQIQSITAALAAAAKKEMLEMQALLGKIETGTVTRNDMTRLSSLTRGLRATKSSIRESKIREGHLAVKSDVYQQIRAVKEKEIQKVAFAVSKAESVDLAFVVDATNSMCNHIDAVKQSIRTVVADIKRTHQRFRLRLAIVIYRDIELGYRRFEMLDFVDDVCTFEDFLHQITTSQSHDDCEDMAIGIQYANRLSWRQSTRVTMIIADCPCHGSKFQALDGRCLDYYPQGTPGIDICQELQKLKANVGNGTMSLYFGRIRCYTDRMIEVFREHGIGIEVLPFDDLKAVASSITSSVRESISQTMIVSGSGLRPLSFTPSLSSVPEPGFPGHKVKASLKKYSIVPRQPILNEWKEIASVKVYRNVPVKSMSDLQTPLGFGLMKLFGRHTDKTNESQMFLRRSWEPFAEGEIRIAFHGHLAHVKAELDQPQSVTVLKAFKHVGKGLNDRRQYLKQTEVSTIARFLARAYNESPLRPAHCARIEVLQVCVVEEENDDHESEGNRRFSAEPYLSPTDGVFTKYSNNTGYWNTDALDETLLRFTDFTYRATKGYLTVTDLQGVKKGDRFVLTDPIILCTDIVRFGHTNLGKAFMHKCIDATRAHMAENGWY